MSNNKIKNIPHFQELSNNIENLKKLKSLMPILRPFLRLFSVDVTTMDKAFAQLDSLSEQVESLTSLPDRFNDLLSSRGWIMYEMMNKDKALSVIEKAEAGEIEDAENELVEYYSVETIKMQLLWMRHVQAFRLRIPLAMKALEDYEHERYHACVPVVLALLDGMVNEIAKNRRGFFADDANLEAWDTIAGHSKGLSELSRVMSQSRQKTRSEQITIPYRNGILHGMDLGYANKVVAAKSWAALFAVREWAMRAEKNMLDAQPTKKATWQEIIQKVSDNNDEQKKLDAWKPRSIKVGVNMPASGLPDVYQANTPEQKLAEYLNFWKIRNYGNMAKCLSSKSQYETLSKTAGRIREIFAAKKLEGFEFLEIEDYAAATSTIKTKLIYSQDGKMIDREVSFTMVCEDDSGHYCVRDNPNSKWGVDNWLIF